MLIMSVSVGGGVSDDVRHQVHQYLHIHEVCAMRGVSRASREHIWRCLARYSWDAVYPAPCSSDAVVPAVVWLQGLCEADVKMRTFTLVRHVSVPLLV